MEYGLMPSRYSQKFAEKLTQNTKNLFKVQGLITEAIPLKKIMLCSLLG